MTLYRVVTQLFIVTCADEGVAKFLATWREHYKTGEIKCLIYSGSSIILPPLHSLPLSALWFI